jgi:hypothetical protein
MIFMSRLIPALLLISISATLPALALQGQTIAFTNVHVVPMTRDTVLRNQTVVIRNGRIASIAPAGAAPAPTGVRQIDGAGRAWLIPGLADMHVHMFDRGEFTMYLANGITTVRNLHGIPQHLAWRDSIARGDLLGPRLFTSGPILDGDPPSRGTNTVLRTREDAERAVAEQKAAGYDLIKVYDNLPRDLYEALAAAARRAELPLVGHVPTPVGLAGLLEVNGQIGIEHVEELLPFFRGGADTTGLAEAARALARQGVWVTPTITVFRSALDQAMDWPAVQARPEMRYMNPETEETWGWMPTGEGRSGNPRAQAGFDRSVRFFETQMIPALHHAGVRLLAGSDAPIPAIVPGYSLLGELETFVRSGLTPFEAMVTATRNAALFMGRAGEFGTIEVGAAADLVLLSADPLADIGNLAKRVGVMREGRWLPQAELTRLLEDLVAERKQASR